MIQAEVILMLAQAWGVIGALVAVPFLIFGMDQIDEDARGAYVFRPLLVPGILLIWPLVLWRWWVLASDRDTWAKRYRPVRKSHQWFAFAMTLAIPLIIIAGLSVRQVWPADIAPVQLTPPTETVE